MSIYLDNDINYYKSELESKDQQIKDLEDKLSKINNWEKRADQDLCMRLVLDHFFPPPNYDERSYDEMMYQLKFYQQKYLTK